MNPPADQPMADAGPLLSVDAACRLILGQVRPLTAQEVPLLQALNRFAAKPVLATQALPGFDNSSMDGYALMLPERSDPLPAGTRLEVIGEQAAGPTKGLSVGPGQAVRIFTGAPVPAGSGAVVMQEDAAREGNVITLREPVQAGEFIRRAGGDLAEGQTLFDAGEKLTPQRLGLLASQGMARVGVSRVPKVAILATGDELRAPGEPLGPGEIYESNGILLAALAASAGAQPTLLKRARDERADLDAKITAGLHGHDVLVIAGGVSVGERDFVKERLHAAGVSLDLWRVSMQPGKPFLYGRSTPQEGALSTHVFGLPGNPVSACATFLLFVRPALRALMGAAQEHLHLPRIQATAAMDLVHRGNRPHYLRGTLDEAGRFAVSGRQESHALFALSRSRALVRLEPGAALPAGSPVEALVWD